MEADSDKFVTINNVWDIQIYNVLNYYLLGMSLGDLIQMTTFSISLYYCSLKMIKSFLQNSCHFEGWFVGWSNQIHIQSLNSIREIK